jgi:hypothetical protein
MVYGTGLVKFPQQETGQYAELARSLPRGDCF